VQSAASEITSEKYTTSQTRHYSEIMQKYETPYSSIILLFLVNRI